MFPKQEKCELNKRLDFFLYQRDNKIDKILGLINHYDQVSMGTTGCSHSNWQPCIPLTMHNQHKSWSLGHQPSFLQQVLLDHKWQDRTQNSIPALKVTPGWQATSAQLFGQESALGWVKGGGIRASVHISGKDLAAREVRRKRKEKNVGAKPLRRLTWGEGIQQQMGMRKIWGVVESSRTW